MDEDLPFRRTATPRRRCACMLLAPPRDIGRTRRDASAATRCAVGVGDSPDATARVRAIAAMKFASAASRRPAGGSMRANVPAGRAACRGQHQLLATIAGLRSRGRSPPNARLPLRGRCGSWRRGRCQPEARHRPGHLVHTMAAGRASSICALAMSQLGQSGPTGTGCAARRRRTARRPGSTTSPRAWGTIEEARDGAVAHQLRISMRAHARIVAANTCRREAASGLGNKKRAGLHRPFLQAAICLERSDDPRIRRRRP